MPIVASREISTEQEPLIVVRTSDRMLFKKCRRLWGWTSHLKMGLQIKEGADYFWFGSGFHYALEEFHGSNRYGHPGKAFLAYVEATRLEGTAPSTWRELLPTGVGMLSYYADHWLPNKDPLKTFYLNDEPQLEVNGYIDLGVRHRGMRVVYGFTLDRMIVDDAGQLFIGEYKTAKAFRTFHYDTDEQCTAYCWAANRLYNLPVSGVWYYQFKKQVPALPRILSTGLVSTAPNQPTTSALYRKQLRDIYGDLNIAPAKNIKFLNDLTTEETEDQDKFIRRECIERNQRQIDQFEARVMLELEDILNDDLPLYPNQSKDCSWSCPLQHACIAMEDGSDYESIIAMYAKYPNYSESTRWRNLLPPPSEVHLPAESALYRETLLEMQQQDKQGWDPQVTPEEAFLAELW